MGVLDSHIISNRARVENAARAVADGAGINLEYVSLVDGEKPKDYVTGTGLPYGQYPIGGDLVQRVQWNFDSGEWEDFGSPQPTLNYVDNRGTINSDSKSTISVRKGTSQQIENESISEGEIYYDLDEDRGVFGTAKQYLVGLRDIFVKIDSVEDLIGDTPSWFELLFSSTPTRKAIGFYPDTIEGGGEFIWDSDKPKSDHNGIATINPDHNSVLGSENWYSSTGDSTDDTGTGCWVRRVSVLTPRMAGAITHEESAEHDSTLAVQAAIDTGRRVVVTDGTYNITGISVTTPLHIGEGSEFRYIDSGGQGISIDSAVDCGDIYFNGNNNHCVGVIFSVNGATAKTIKVKNVIAPDVSSTSIYPVGFNADNIKINQIFLVDNNNTGHTNPSFPQGCAIVGSSNNIEIGSITQENGATGLVVGVQAGEVSVGRIDLNNTADNGCYLLGGDVSIDSIYYSGNNETVVAKGNANIGSITTYGDCFFAIGIENAGDVNVDNITIVPNSAGDTANAVILTRSGNNASGKITIGAVKGTIRTDVLLSLDDGTVEYFNIKDIDIKQYYKDHGNSISRYFDLRGCDGFDVRDVNIRLIDPADTLVNTDFFISNPGMPTKDSFIYDFNVHTLQSDEVSIAPFVFRGQYAGDNIETRGGRWQVNIGPHCREVSYTPSNTSNQIPSNSAFPVGKRLYKPTPTSGDFIGWVHVGGGTWKQFGAIEA